MSTAFTTRSVKYAILAGPSEESLFLALRNFYDKHDLDFTLGGPGIVKLLIKEIAAEGSRNGWNIRGFAYNNANLSGNFSGYYNARTRTGNLIFEVE